VSEGVFPKKKKIAFSDRKVGFIMWDGIEGEA
jgi:hypothetical protein